MVFVYGVLQQSLNIMRFLEGFRIETKQNILPIVKMNHVSAAEKDELSKVSSV